MRRVYLDKSSRWLNRMLRRKRGQRRRGPRRVAGPDRPDRNNEIDHFELYTDPPHLPPVLFDLGTDRYSHVLDAKCIVWTFETFTDSDIIPCITKFIPEIIWHNGIQTTPLERLYDTVVECFDHSSGKPVVASKLRDKAYSSAKALPHIAVQRKCMADESDAGVFAYISYRHAENIGSTYFKGDPDLDSTLGMIDRVFLDRIEFEAMDWQQLSLTDSHRTWMSRVLLSLAWDAIGKGQPLPTDVQAFVRHSLGLVPPPPAQTVRDCLYVVELILKTSLEDDKPHAIDIGPQIVRIYQNLLGTFQKNNPTPTEIDRALEAMSLISPLSNQEVAAKSFELFYVIMRAPVPSAYSGNAWEVKKWEASRLALHGAYKWDGALPEVEDPQAILNFLCHHFELALVKNGKPQDEPIQDALHALAYASTSKAIETIEEFDPTRPSFVHGICFAFQDKRSSKLHRAALFFLRLIAKNWFSAPGAIMTPEITKSLCVDWASAVDEFHSDSHVQNVALEVLLDMMNSSHWCPHIVPKKWRLLERFIPAVPSGVEPLERCLGNVGLIGEISKMKNTEAMTLWSTILWLKYAELEREVQEKLESVTKVVDKYLPTVESAYEEAKRRNGTCPNDTTFEKTMENLEAARKRLNCLKGGH
ncbi:hypothetical protein BJ322DRAFT_824007 [Thelephora terrestris]|uniref:Uncharacterized protein n=1 Tax=Thelephora terrestris TaxID=56493 RepID=A0A9P6HEZ1_9AGAM|nr:hypothetical protein BJ322DRAFT_824007 [Thelephora terrestris]